jgi:spermidine synthase
MKIKINSHQIILFIISGIVISNQLALIQYFAYQQWYNFASVVISLALFGFGVSGLIISKIKKETLDEADETIQKILITYGLYVPISILIEKYLIGSFDSYLVFFDVSETIKFFLVIFNYSIPFCFIAILIGLIFTISSEKIGTLYFFNLIGSGIGGILVVYLLWLFEPHKIYISTGLIISLIGLIFYLATCEQRISLRITFNLIVIVLNFVLIFAPFENIPSQFKSLSRIKNFPDARIVREQFSPYGKVEIVSSSLLRYSPGLTLNFTGVVPQGEAIFLNAELAGFKISESSNYDYDFLKKSTLYLPFLLKQSNNALILNPSGGVEIYRAVISDVNEIYVNEKNPILFNLISSEFARNEKEKIKLINEDPRIFLEKFNSKFDLIYHPVIEPVGYSSGLYSVQEKFLFTQEAFQKIYNALNEDGYFSISCYIDNPVKTFLKLLNTLTEIRDSKGTKVRPEQILAINNWNVITIMLKKGTFNEDEISKAEKFCNENQFDILIHPIENRMVRFNSVIEAQIFNLIDAILNGKREELGNYVFNLSQSTDDKPYFSNFIIPTRFKFYLEQISLRNLTYSEVGYFLIWLAFLVLLLFSTVLIFLAFSLIKIDTKKLKLNLLVYFSTIGLAFMFIELSLIQKFTLIFSNDVFAISFIISLLLISSGTGSYFSQRIFDFMKRFQLFFVLIIFTNLIFLIFSYQIVVWLMNWNGFLKYLFAGLIIFPLGFFIGIPFPYGIRRLCSQDKNAVPFAWAINGGFSVLGSVASIILLVNFGFNFSFLMAITLYFFLGIFIYFQK